MKGIKYTSREKFKALQMWLSGEDILRVAKRFKCTERSLWRWKAAFDGTIESLENKSSRPHTPHPNSHTAEEREHITQMFESNPNMGYAELYGELRAKYAYKRHFMSMYNFIRKNCLRPVNVYNDYIPQPYETPEMLGVKMQMDVKYVPRECLVGQAKKNYDQIGQKFYQYTMIDEATRERLTEEENGKHRHGKIFSQAFGGEGQPLSSTYGADGSEKAGVSINSGGPHLYGTNESGEGLPHNNMPPYIVIYRWRRIA